MPLSTTNPPVEITIPAFTVASPQVGATGTPTQWYYHCSRVFATGSCVTSGVNVVAGSAGAATVRVFLLDDYQWTGVGYSNQSDSRFSRQHLCGRFGSIAGNPNERHDYASYGLRYRKSADCLALLSNRR